MPVARLARRRPTGHLGLEPLEDRLAPATFTVTTAHDAGPGSLRAALAHAAAAVGHDTVDFDPALAGQTIRLATTLRVDQHVTIDGPGADRLAVSGGGVTDVFAVVGGTVTIRGLTIRDGVYSATAAGPGSGGGVYNTATLTVDRCAILWNAARGAPGRGGGVYNAGSLTLTRSLVADNAAVGTTVGASDGAYGGGLCNTGTAVVLETTFAGNSVRGGPTLNGAGGGVANLGGSLTLVNCTVAQNTVTSPFAVPAAHGGGVYSDPAGGTVELRNTVVTANRVSAGDSTNPAFADVSGPLAGGFNLIGGDARLGPLQNNGGPTATFAPQPGSPAVDAGDPTYHPADWTDQRGEPRVSNGRIDLGAVEVHVPPVPPPSPPPPPPPPPPPSRGRLAAMGTDAGPVATARLLNPDGSARFEVRPYGDGFTGGVRVAVGDVDGDGTADLVTAPGPGGGPLVRVFAGTDGRELGSFLAFEETFLGGVYVAAADLDRDGVTEIVVSPDQSGGPRVRVVRGATGGVSVADFFGIDDPNFRGGARVGLGDVTGDGWVDLVVGAGFGGGPRVAVFSGAWLLVAPSTPTRVVPDFFAFESALRNGAYVAAGDLDGDGFAELVFGGGPGGGPRVLAWDGARFAPSGGADRAEVANFFAFDPALRGGVRVTVGDVTGDGLGDVVVGPGPGGGGPVVAFPGPRPGPAAPVLLGDAAPGGGAGLFPAAEPLPPLAPPSPLPTGPGGGGSGRGIHENILYLVNGRTYSGSAPVGYTRNGILSTFREGQARVRFTVESMTRSPGNSTPYQYAITGRVKLEVIDDPAAVGVDLPVTGYFIAKEFRDDFPVVGEVQVWSGEGAGARDPSVSWTLAWSYDFQSALIHHPAGDASRNLRWQGVFGETVTTGHALWEQFYSFGYTFSPG